MKTGTLFYNETNKRMDVKFTNGEEYGGLHCGQCLDAKKNGRYVPTRIEMSDDWYLVETGLKGITNLTGLKIRM